MYREQDGASGRRLTDDWVCNGPDLKKANADKSGIEAKIESDNECDDLEVTSREMLRDGADPEIKRTEMYAEFGKRSALRVNGSERIVAFCLTLVALIVAGFLWLVSPVVSIALLCVIVGFGVALTIATWRR